MLAAREFHGRAFRELGAEDLGGAVREGDADAGADLDLDAKLLLLVQVVRLLSRGGAIGHLLVRSKINAPVLRTRTAVCAVAAALRSRAPGSFGRGLGREGSIRVCASARIDVVWWTSERRRAVCALLGFRGFPICAPRKKGRTCSREDLCLSVCRLTAGPNHVVWGEVSTFFWTFQPQSGHAPT